MIDSNNNKENNDKKYILLITDPGRDVDDVIAITTLVGVYDQNEYKLAAVITSGGAGLKRACIVRGWLRSMNIKDEDLPVCPGVEEGRQEAHTPSNFPLTSQEACLFDYNKKDKKEKLCVDFIVEQIEKYGHNLIIVAIAPLTPLAQVITKGYGEYLKNISSLYIQGQAIITTPENTNNKSILQPDFSAFNLREDEESSKIVFEYLQNYIPFHLLGKHAAYCVSLYKKDFESWERPPNLPSMVENVKATQDVFRKSNPELFQKLYKIPMDIVLDDERWFNELDEISHPYDPLTILYMIQPNLFQPISISPHHTLVGMSSENTGIIDNDKVRNNLTKLIEKGVDRSTTRDNPDNINNILMKI